MVEDWERGSDVSYILCCIPLSFPLSFLPRTEQLMDRSKTLSSVEVSKLEAGVNDANRSLHQFCLGKSDHAQVHCSQLTASCATSDNPEEGPPALACFIIAALCPLSRRWLFMEQTAQGPYRI